MTDNNALAQLKGCPNPWCNSHKSNDPEIRAAEAPILMPSRASFEWCVACPVCPMQSPWRDTEAEAVAAWNKRTPAPVAGEVGESTIEMTEAERDFAHDLLKEKNLEIERLKVVNTIPMGQVHEVLEWALNHIGGHCRYDSAEQVVNCLEKSHDMLERLAGPVQGVEQYPWDNWQNCPIGSCQRHEKCMYFQCRAPEPVHQPGGDQVAAVTAAIKSEIMSLSGSKRRVTYDAIARAALAAMQAKENNP